MLIGFTFKNFASFYNENALSMRSSADKKFSTLNTKETKYGRLIKSAFIFGANGSGKSNLVRAIDCMKSIVVAEHPGVQSVLIANIDFFKLSNVSEAMPSLFEVEFISNGMVYQYGFEILNREVCREYLYRKTKRKTLVFARVSPDFKDISLSSSMDNVKHLVQNTRRDTLFLCWANAGNNEIAMVVYNWFASIRIFDNATLAPSDTIEYLKENSDGKNKVLRLLQTADSSILDFSVETSENKEQSELATASQQVALKKVFGKNILPVPIMVRNIDLKLSRNYYNEKWERVGTFDIPAFIESAGTRKLFEIAGPIIRALENGSVVFVDEVDSRLHPMLVRFLVMMFNSISNNQKGAQLICATHDLLLLGDDIRRDQIYFTEKDEFGISSLYSLADFKGVRKDGKFLKQYLLGAFGATPKLREYCVAKMPIGANYGYA